jgi:hypothetical protein
MLTKMDGMPYGATKIVRINELQKIVIAKFLYRNPQSGEDFTVERSWPCKDQTDAESSVKYHGQKTGALSAECKIEVMDNEESK